MSPGSPARLPDNRTARRTAPAAIKAHPIAATFAILALALPLLAASGEHGHPRRHQILSMTVTAPEARAGGAGDMTPATSASLGVHGRQGRAASPQHESQRRPVGARTQASSRAPWPRGAQKPARRFLNTYLRFTYGQLPARDIAGATPQLRARLAANPPAVPAATRRLRSHITALALIPARIADAGPGWAATATVTDRQETYQVTVKLGRRHGRWLITAIRAE